MTIKINYFGLLRSPVSWAKIGREIIGEFVNRGDEVCVFERKGFRYNSGFEIPDSKSIQNRFLYDRTLTFEYPKNYKLITTKYKCGMLVYETTEAPPSWIPYINKHLDILFLPNEFNKKIFLDAGVKEEIIRVVPYGVNNFVFKPKAQGQKPEEAPARKKTFRFLCVAMPQKRKGLDVLIPAFENIFGGRSGAELIIKFPYKPGNSRYDYIPKAGSENIRFLTGEFSEKQMAKLYQSADCFVLPSRAEGFGMIYIEALASGLPVIATGWGGHMDFLNEKNAALINYKLVPAGGMQYDNPEGRGLCAEPDINDLAEKLITAYEGKIQKPEFEIKRFYWENIVKKMKTYIRNV